MQMINLHGGRSSVMPSFPAGCRYKAIKSNQLSNLGKVIDNLFTQRVHYQPSNNFIYIFFKERNNVFFNAVSSSSRSRRMQTKFGAISAILLFIILRVYLY